MDGELLYQCSPENFIHCFCSTTKHLIIAESPIDHPTNVTLHYINETNATKSTIVSTNVLTSIHRDLGPRTLIIKNIFITKTNPIYLVVNSSDGIQIFPFASKTDKKNQNINENKWFLQNINDSINSFDILEETDEFLDICLGTILGHLIYIRYETLNESFVILKKFDKWKNIAQDSINCIKCIDGDIAIASFDNSIYTIIDKKFESQSVSNDIIHNSEQTKENTLISLDMLKIKKYSSSFNRFYLVNVTNFGCLLYKKGVRGQWELIHEFEKDLEDSIETSSSVDCIIERSGNSDDLHLFSGSENGKLYYWTFNHKEKSIKDRKVLRIANNGLVHNLSMPSLGRINLLANNDTCMMTVHI